MRTSQLRTRTIGYNAYGEHEFVNCRGTAETFALQFAIPSPDKFAIMRLKKLPEYFAQASYSAVEELYKSKAYQEKK